MTEDDVYLSLLFIMNIRLRLLGVIRAEYPTACGFPDVIRSMSMLVQTETISQSTVTHYPIFHMYEQVCLFVVPVRPIVTELCLLEKPKLLVLVQGSRLDFLVNV